MIKWHRTEKVTTPYTAQLTNNVHVHVVITMFTVTTGFLWSPKVPRKSLETAQAGLKPTAHF